MTQFRSVKGERVSDWRVPDIVKNASEEMRKLYKLCNINSFFSRSSPLCFSLEYTEHGSYIVCCAGGSLSVGVGDIGGPSPEIAFARFYGYLGAHPDGIRVSRIGKDSFSFLLQQKGNRLVMSHVELSSADPGD
ncbi:MAG: hypothetical protein Q7S84_01650 [bacterium]|nr:hypothetical protein [bacterium]